MSSLQQLWERPWSVRQIALGTVVVTSVAAAFWLLFVFHEMVLILLAAVVISTAVQIPVSFLTARGFSKASAIFLVFLLGLVLLTLIGWLLVPLIGSQVIVMGQELADRYLAVRTQMIASPNLMLRRLGTSIPQQLPAISLFAATETAVSDNTDLAQTVQMATDLIMPLLKLVITIVMAFYWTWEGHHIQQRIFLLLPLSQRDHIRQLVKRIETKVGQYIIGQGFLSFLVGTASLVAYLLIGLPYAFALAIFAGLMEAVPLIGPWIGAVPALLIALSVSPSSVIWVAVASLVIQQVENNVLVPRVMKRTVGVRPLVSLLFLLGLGLLFGVIGALIAIPLAATFQLLLDDLLQNQAQEAQSLAQGRDQLSRLHYQTELLIQDIRSHIREKHDISTGVTDEIEDQVELMAHDLQMLLLQQQEEQP